jgi:hypothetical protein
MRVNPPAVNRADFRYTIMTGLLPTYPVNKMG